MAAREGRDHLSPVEGRILAAAVRLFAEKGFDGTSVQEIVERADVTKGALYHYFASKGDLLFEIYHNLLSRQFADLNRILAMGLPPEDTIRAVITELVETTAEQVDEVKVYVREMHKLDLKRLRSVRADRRRYHVTFRKVIEEGQRSGRFSTVSSAEMVTFIIFGVINEMPLWYRASGPKAPAQIADEVTSFVLAALDPEQPRSAGPRSPGPRSPGPRSPEPTPAQPTPASSAG